MYAQVITVITRIVILIIKQNGCCIKFIHSLALIGKTMNHWSYVREAATTHLVIFSYFMVVFSVMAI
jgi:hypothetical protein